MLTLALTPGCPAGIGPEIFPAAITTARFSSTTRFLWCASAALMQKHAQASAIDCTRRGNTVILKSTRGDISIECLVDDESDLALKVSPANVSVHALTSQCQSLALAVELAQSGKIHGMVTGPIRKAALVDVDGMRFDGQTEYLYHHLAADADAPLMCFAGADFLLGLASIHVPLKDVSRLITKERLSSKIKRLREACTAYFDLDETNIRIGVLGLNPHAGENGLIGDEEIEIIKPTINELSGQGFAIEGPYAADGFFGHLAMQPTASLPHAVLAMYHDQGLGPYKLLCKGICVNMTIGLRVIRTSPAHGTADALAGSYTADFSSLARAIEIAEKMAIFKL